MFSAATGHSRRTRLIVKEANVVLRQWQLRKQRVHFCGRQDVIDERQLVDNRLHALTRPISVGIGGVTQTQVILNTALHDS